MVFQELIANFRTAVMGYLSPAEKLAVQRAQKTLREGWPGQDRDFSDSPPST
jgi:hypothetical protein